MNTSTAPRITLVTPSLNAAKTIDRTMRSIEIQDYPNLQLICIDGGSSDGTLEILSRYSHIIDILISEKDRNVANAVNKGFQHADGQIYGYLNADDALEPGALDLVASILDGKGQSDVVTGGCRRVFADGSELVTQVPDNFLLVLSMRNDIEQPSTFWTARIHRALGKFDETYQLAFDWEWWNRLLESDAKFERTTTVLSTYYFSEDNLTSRGGMQIIDEMYKVTRRYGPYRGRIADVYRLLLKFDMRGYYDKPFGSLQPWKQFIFGSVLWLLYRAFDRTSINSYNWNWASKQVRGVVWYK